MPYSAPHSQRRDGLVADPFVFLLELYNSACKRTQSLALGSADILLCTALLSKDATVGSSAGGQDNKKWWPRVYWKESYDKPRQHIKKQRHHFADKGPYSQSYGFYSSHVWMWELGHEEGWTLKINNVLLEKTLDSPMDWNTPGFPVLYYLLEFAHSCPLSQWCHPTISSSVIPFSSCHQSFPASRSFPTSWLLASGGQSIGASISASVPPMNIQDWFQWIFRKIKLENVILSIWVFFWQVEGVTFALGQSEPLQHCIPSTLGSGSRQSAHIGSQF